MNEINIHHLPDELLEVIGSFLTKEDLDACYYVCLRWRRVFNVDKIWKKHCLFAEKYHKDIIQKIDTNKSVWRCCFEQEKIIFRNWSTGKYLLEKTGLNSSNISSSLQYVSNEGSRFLFTSEGCINIWNITKPPASLHCKLNENSHIGTLLLNEKFLTFRSNYIKVFRFSKPDYKALLLYRFITDDEATLPETSDIPDDYYATGFRFITFENFFIGYYESIHNINDCYVHIWDLDAGKKIAKQSVFQESFVKYIFESTGEQVSNQFSGGLLLFEGDSGRFLVNLISDVHKICQVSLFSLRGMKFTNVIARFKSRTTWCFLKEDIVAIYHVSPDETSSFISVFLVNGQFIAKLDFPYSYNPVFNGEFCFSKSRMILKIDSYLHILNLHDLKNASVKILKIPNMKSILAYFEPKFLLLSDSYCRRSCLPKPLEVYSVSVWDVVSGRELWEIGAIPADSFHICMDLFKKTEYIGKLILHLNGNDELCVLNFENS